MAAATELLANIQDVRARIAKACYKAGRNPAKVTLMAVTKYAPDDDVLALLEAGQILHIGESRVQQAAARWARPEFSRYPAVKHFIGHLQRNKAAKAAELFDFIDSLDDLHTAAALNEKAQRLNKTLGILVQVKLTDRQTQSGLGLQDAAQFVRELKQFGHLRPCGYMSIAPQTPDPQTLRPLFKAVCARFEADFPPSQTQRYLSLGMSEDFEVAVEEGSLLPRIGSGIFARKLEVS